jgi:enolase
VPAIERIHAREVFDSRGKPTVEVEVQCAGARPGRAIVPSGASTGRFEALELRDGDERLDGDGVLRAVANVNGEIAAALAGEDAADQPRIDRLLCDLDGTPNKSRLGANAILGVSLATAHAAAESAEESLTQHIHSLWSAFAVSHKPPTIPLPMVNMISGGLHAGDNLDIQDVLIIPVGADSFRQAVEWTVTVYRRLGGLLGDAGYEGRLVGDEGGYGPRLKSNREALEFVVGAIEDARLTPGKDVAIGLDVASTHFYEHELDIYRFASSEQGKVTSEELINLLESWVDEFPIVSIEDGLAEDDWTGWKELTARLGDRVQLIGDDLFVTNGRRLERGIADGVANSILIKPNQIGTLTETLQTMQMAVGTGYRPVVSARSGETEDATIADLAVATAAGQIKIGSIARSERLAKYNRLLRLSERYRDYAGGSALSEPGGSLTWS